jgi:hypothetical protein
MAVWMPLVDNLLRNDLILIDLCRHRNYADGAPNIAGPRSRRQFSHRHSPRVMPY